MTEHVFDTANLMAELGVLYDQLTLSPTIIDNGQHKLVGSFPAPADYVGNSDVVAVHSDRQSLGQWQDDYCDEEFTPGILDLLYISGGVAAAVLREQLNLKHIDHIQEVHATLSSADTLSSQILEAADDGLVSRADEKTLLLALREGWLVPDIAVVNGMRLAVGLAALVRGEVGQKAVDVTKETMRFHLGETLERWVIFKETRRMLGEVSLEKSKEQFMNTTPMIEVVGGFPMPPTEVERLTLTIISPESNPGS